MEIIKIEDFSDPRLDVFVRLTGAQLRSKLESEKGVFIAESPTVIEVALDSGCEPIALLTDERLINGAVKKIIDRCGGVPIYSATKDVLEQLTGFALTRGALCAMKRPEPKSLSELLDGARTVAVLETIADSTNIGAIFRSAAALGVDAVLVTPDCCDPLCRRAVRVSMGTIFRVPWGVIGEDHEDWRRRGIDLLHEHGFKTAAMALTSDSVNIDDPALMKEEKIAVILGTEGTGLSKSTIENSDYTVMIPMANEVDSLNVAAAGVIAFWQLTRRTR
jgi:tRNA G18 (ribose-2'-O)-methylase SpoU